MIVNVDDWWLKTLEDNIKFYRNQVYKVNMEFDNYKEIVRKNNKYLNEELKEFRKKEDAYRRFQAKRRKMVEYQHSLEAKITRQRDRIKDLEDDLQNIKRDCIELEEYYTDLIDRIW